MSSRRIAFADLAFAQIQLDAIYEGGSSGNIGDDALGKLLPVGNAGGFRFKGRPTRGSVRIAVLFTSTVDPDWPDTLDLAAGTFTYYGDNKAAGKGLHDTPRKGNVFLREVFELASAGADGRRRVPPILLFARAGAGHDVAFRGLLVPGTRSSRIDEDLVAVWRSKAGQRFQNYRATFTVLDVAEVERAWLETWDTDAPLQVPNAWERWVTTGAPEPLTAPRVTAFRTREEQLPADPAGQRMLEEIYKHFAERPHDFEACAAEVWSMIAPATEEIAITRRSRDGGRDAVGRYAIGPRSDQVRIDFALEAKCYAPGNAVGVKEMSRLISRLRHRDFGVLVTTSYVHNQAYAEVREDGHPVAIVSGRDIVDALRAAGIGDLVSARAWLNEFFPIGGQQQPSPRGLQHL